MIKKGDVVLLASKVMADVPHGGGAPSGTVIQDGAENGIFPDSSELDRTLGRVAMRKVFVGVRSDDADTYYGTNVIVEEGPEDPLVSITLFAAASAFETRAEAQKRIEAYLNQGAEVSGYLYGDHVQGQRSVQLFQRSGAALPNVNSTLVLIEGSGAALKAQYVRIAKVAAVTRTFTHSYGDTYADYQAQVVTLSIADKLVHDFKGSPAARSFAKLTDACVVRETVVADAGTYVGISKLVQDASIGDYTIKASSIFTQLVPSSQTPIPITAQKPYAAAAIPVQSAQRITFVTTLPWHSTAPLQLPGGFLPGTLSVQVGGVTIFDAAGELRSANGPLGHADYANGILNANGMLAGTKTIVYAPAAQLLRAPQSTCIDVTLESRTEVYVGMIWPAPQPGTTSFSYMVQGRWFVLQDAGDGRLKGVDSSYGAGTIDCDTGAYAVTLGALPDVGSAIIITSGVPTQETRHGLLDLPVSHTQQLSPPYGLAVQPGSMTLEWPNAQGGTDTAAVGADGVLTGAARGRFLAGVDKLEFAPLVLPPVGAQVIARYVAGQKQIDNFSHPSRNGQGRVTVSASLGAITPGSLSVEWNTLTDISVLGVYTRAQLTEMGVSFPVDPTQYACDDGAGRLMLGDVQVGTVDYGLGVVTWQPDVVIKIPRPAFAPQNIAGITNRWRLSYAGIDYVDAPSLYPNDELGWVKISYNAPGGTSAQEEQFTFAPQLELLPGVQAPIVPGALTLALGSVTESAGRIHVDSAAAVWQDDGVGSLRQLAADGSGWITRGTINYLQATCALTSWTPGAANALTRLGCVSTLGDTIDSEFVFRTAAAPVRPGSLSLQFARAGGGAQTVTAGLDGTIAAPGINAQVDYQAGLARLRFGEFVTAAGNESQPWFNPDAVGEDGKIWRPAPIALSTLLYACVSYSYLPIDASLLGIDPVRLPSDGRVPIYRAGGVVVVGNTKRITATVSAGQTISCARVRLSRVRVKDAAGAPIFEGYTEDLEAGLVKIVDPESYNQPIKIEHRVEDTVAVREVDINGDLHLVRPLTHDYLAGESYISGALLIGDKFADVPVMFVQQAGLNAWKDVKEGPEIVANYSGRIEVTNRGAVTERWMLRFTSSTAYDVVGEHLGVIAQGNTQIDCAPVNREAGAPYFVLRALGLSGGWAQGNILRFNTAGANPGFWVVRTIQPGPEAVASDQFAIAVRGDVNRP